MFFNHSVQFLIKKTSTFTCIIYLKLPNLIELSFSHTYNMTRTDSKFRKSGQINSNTGCSF